MEPYIFNKIFFDIPLLFHFFINSLFFFSLISDFVITVSVFVLPNYFKNGKMAEPNEWTLDFNFFLFAVLLVYK